MEPNVTTSTAPLLPVILVTPSVPEWFLVQTTDLSLRQMSRGLVSGAPAWWRLRFGTNPKFPPVPLRMHLEVPVFGIDVPCAALDVMLEMIQVPENIPDYWRSLPAVLDGLMTLKTWRGYMRAYDFVDTTNLDADPDEPDPKRRRLNPFQETLAEVAAILHTYIFTHHPKAPLYVAGQVRRLGCQVVAKYTSPKGTYSGNVHTTTIDCAPLSSGIMQPYQYLFCYLSTEHAAFVCGILEDLSPAGTTVKMRNIHEHNGELAARYDTGTEYKEWPLSPDDATPVTVFKRFHGVGSIVFSYK